MNEEEMSFAIEKLEKLQNCLRLKSGCDKACDKCLLHTTSADANKALEMVIRHLYRKQWCTNSVQDPY